MKKILISMVCAIALFNSTVFAQIPFTETRLAKNDSVHRRVINTGNGYFVDNDEGRILYSKDRNKWNDVTDKLPDDIVFYQGTFPQVAVIETDDSFIICNTLFKKGEAYDRIGHLIVTDKDFNVINEIETDRISDVSYFNGVCYINKYLDYVGEPGSDVTNIVTKQTSYYSSDFINWQVYKEDGGIPVINDGREIFIRTNLINIPDTSRIKLPLLEKTDVFSAISNKAVSEQGIMYEDTKFQSLTQFNNYLIGIPESGDSLLVSRDGVYFTDLPLPIKSQVNGIYELDNGNLEISTSKNMCYECSFEDISHTMQISDIYVQFKGQILGFKVPPIIEDGSTLVPMRFLFEQMGADVDWNGATRTATATLDDTAVTFSIDNTQATVNKAPAKMAVPARLIDDKTMVPLRFLSEELGFTVTWDADTRTAIIE